MSVLDASAVALAIARSRLPDAPVRWIVADITTWAPDRTWALWHDRATVHFMTTPAQRAGYLAAMAAAVPPGGAIVMATFGPDGPDRCSGQFVEPVVERTESHPTPGGAAQPFTWVAFRRT